MSDIDSAVLDALDNALDVVSTQASYSPGITPQSSTVQMRWSLKAKRIGSILTSGPVYANRYSLKFLQTRNGENKTVFGGYFRKNISEEIDENSNGISIDDSIFTGINEIGTGASINSSSIIYEHQVGDILIVYVTQEILELVNSEWVPIDLPNSNKLVSDSKDYVIASTPNVPSTNFVFRKNQPLRITATIDVEKHIGDETGDINNFIFEFFAHDYLFPKRNKKNGAYELDSNDARINFVERPNNMLRYTMDFPVNEEEDTGSGIAGLGRTYKIVTYLKNIAGTTKSIDFPSVSTNFEPQIPVLNSVSYDNVLNKVLVNYTGDDDGKHVINVYDGNDSIAFTYIVESFLNVSNTTTNPPVKNALNQTIYSFEPPASMSNKLYSFKLKSLYEDDTGVLNRYSSESNNRLFVVPVKPDFSLSNFNLDVNYENKIIITTLSLDSSRTNQVFLENDDSWSAKCQLYVGTTLKVDKTVPLALRGPTQSFPQNDPGFTITEEEYLSGINVNVELTRALNYNGFFSTHNEVATYYNTVYVPFMTVNREITTPGVLGRVRTTPMTELLSNIELIMSINDSEIDANTQYEVALFRSTTSNDVTQIMPRSPSGNHPGTSVPLYVEPLIIKSTNPIGSQGKAMLSLYPADIPATPGGFLTKLVQGEEYVMAFRNKKTINNIIDWTSEWGLTAPFSLEHFKPILNGVSYNSLNNKIEVSYRSVDNAKHEIYFYDGQNNVDYTETAESFLNAIAGSNVIKSGLNTIYSFQPYQPMSNRLYKVGMKTFYPLTSERSGESSRLFFAVPVKPVFSLKNFGINVENDSETINLSVDLYSDRNVFNRLDNSWKINLNLLNESNQNKFSNSNINLTSLLSGNFDPTSNFLTQVENLNGAFILSTNDFLQEWTVSVQLRRNLIANGFGSATGFTEYKNTYENSMITELSLNTIGQLGPAPPIVSLSLLSNNIIQMSMVKGDIIEPTEYDVALFPAEIVSGGPRIKLTSPIQYYPNTTRPMNVVPLITKIETLNPANNDYNIDTIISFFPEEITQGSGNFSNKLEDGEKYVVAARLVTRIGSQISGRTAWGISRSFVKQDLLHLVSVPELVVKNDGIDGNRDIIFEVTASNLDNNTIDKLYIYSCDVTGKPIGLPLCEIDYPNFVSNKIQTRFDLNQISHTAMEYYFRVKLEGSEYVGGFSFVSNSVSPVKYDVYNEPIFTELTVTGNTVTYEISFDNSDKSVLSFIDSSSNQILLQVIPDLISNDDNPSNNPGTYEVFKYSSVGTLSPSGRFRQILSFNNDITGNALIFCVTKNGKFIYKAIGPIYSRLNVQSG